jgi:hypothetical protein
MFWAIILPIFRSTRLCVTVCGIMHPRCCRPPVHYTTSCNTQSSAPEDGQNNCPKHVEVTGIIDNPLLLHLVGCLYYLYQWCVVKQISDNEIYLLIKYIKSVLWRVTKCLSCIEEARCLKVNSEPLLLYWDHLLWQCLKLPTFYLLLYSLRVLSQVHNPKVLIDSKTQHYQYSCDQNG